jgi:hypothetical protein
MGGRRQEDLSGMADGDEAGSTCQRWTDRFVVAHLEIADVDRDPCAVVQDRARRSNGTDRLTEDDIARRPSRAQLGPALRGGGSLEVVVPAAIRPLPLPRVPPSSIIEVGNQYRLALNGWPDTDQQITVLGEDSTLQVLQLG